MKWNLHRHLSIMGLKNGYIASYDMEIYSILGIELLQREIILKRESIM